MADVNNLEKLPKEYDKKVVHEWVKGESRQVIREILNPSNYCIITVQTVGTKTTWSFTRFFILGGKTQVSAEWQGDAQDALQKLIENFEEEHNY
jgi:hypothetical protein